MADFSQLQPLQAQAQSASSDVANLTQNAPGLLQQLQSNLTSIFSKDNPVIEARGQALSDFLSTPARARAEFLPGNMAQIEGSPLTLSPTQQNAITTSRQSAALAPLAGLNQIITGIYGNIPQLVQNAGNVYQGQISAAQQRAQQLQQQYENAYSQILEQEKIRQFNEQFAEQQRQFDIQEKRLGRGSGGGIDFSALNFPQPQARQQTSLYGPPDPRTGLIQNNPGRSTFIPDAPSPYAPASAPINIAPQPSLWDRILGAFGAQPKQEWQQPQSSPLSSYNIGGLSNNIPGFTLGR